MVRGVGRDREQFLQTHAVSFPSEQVFGMRWELYSTVSVLDATELFTLKGELLLWEFHPN